ncbi:hypothetical protein HK097_002564 [Rhizophlyctis rosea]|uniref:Uncharacterized protein n=1 Tax=Rhizophlyctis rosea TaxID=64517 RepID=A0AAD5S3A5_9FUNG|nr:hypothetical protein HK097_002564 [Rhizophlyctis rosea]
MPLPPLNSLPFYNITYTIGGLFAFTSVFLYLIVPLGTIQYFGGTPTPTAEFWARVVAAGDLFFAYLAFECLRPSASEELRQAGARAMAVYGLCHFSTFRFDSVLRSAHPNGDWIYFGGVAGSVVAGGWWGVLRKPTRPDGGRTYETLNDGSSRSV